MKLLRWSIEAYDGLKIMAEALENIKGDVTREKKKRRITAELIKRLKA